MPELLRITGLTKGFAGANALVDVDFGLGAGEVHALVGENGAGKSTLIKLVSGYYRPDGGEIVVNGEVLHAAPHAAHEAGIATIHQEAQLVPAMSVADNLLMGRWPGSRGIVSGRRLRVAAQAALDRVGLEIPLRTPARQLSPAECQLVEIARALAERARVLIMDEPTTSLSSPEIERLFSIVRELKASGMGIIFVSHWLEEVFQIADRVTVLRNGRLVGTHPIDQLDPPRVVRMMVGDDIHETPPSRRELGADVLVVRGLSRGTLFRDVSFTVRAGEIVTLSGLVGAGRTELVRCIFGIDRPDRGEVLVDGRRIRAGSPATAIDSGVGFVPEDRREQGLVEQLSVSSNISLGMLEQLTGLGGILSVRRERRIVDEQMASLDIRAASPSVRIGTLSGGNQQKAIIGRWLARKLRVLILDEPTKGVDVGAKAEIHRLLGELAETGVAVLMVTSELPEVLLLSDRTLVMRMGSVVGELGRDSLESTSIMTLATSG